MKTVIIFQTADMGIAFFVVEGNKNVLDSVYLNEWSESPFYKNWQMELEELIYTEDHTYRHVEYCGFPSHAVREGAIVIVCGELP